jgi:uncharacterized protein
MARLEMSEAYEGRFGSYEVSSEALFDLGMMYCIGREVAQDYVAAHKWFNLAAIRGSEAAKEYRREISREMSAQQIAEAQREARAWMTMH